MTVERIEELAGDLGACAARAEKLLRLACRKGHVVLVTLFKTFLSYLSL